MTGRWRDALLGAMIPGGGALELGFGDLDHRRFWERFGEGAPWLLRFGLGAAVWILTWAPMVRWEYRRPFFRLSPEEQDRCLNRWAGAQSYLLRQLVMTVKLVATLAYFHEPRGRVGFEEGR